MRIVPMTVIALAMTTAGAVAQAPVELGTPLKYVTQAIDGAARYDPAAAGLDGTDLLLHATKDDPTLLAPFREKPHLQIMVRRAGGSVAVLLCADGRALYEDVGCTAAMDRNVAAAPNAACAFALDVSLVCGAQ